MQLIDGIHINKESRVAFVGAGGKSTSMFRLAKQYQGDCIVSTSTHLALSQAKLADHHIIVEAIADFQGLSNTLSAGITLVTGPLWRKDRVGALSEELFQELNNLATNHQVPLLIEADGSRRLPLKAPGEHEPAIPSVANMVVVVAGLGGIGQALNKKTVHRPEIFSERTGLGMGEVIEQIHLMNLLKHPAGGLKNIEKRVEKILFLNQADSSEMVTDVNSMTPKLLEDYDKVVIGSLKKSSDEIQIKKQKIAGIILAAGGSERLGEPKQLLDWHGNPFIRAVAMNAIEAGLDPVIVVTGAYSDKTSEALKGLPVEIVQNNNWQDGQSTSVKKGIYALGENAGGAIFLLVDQPQISATLVKKLLETHSISGEPIIGTLVDDRRGNPVLFDKRTFSELKKIQGDKGGRQIFSNFSVKWMPWLDTIASLDVDTPGDYEKLLNFKDLN